MKTGRLALAAAAVLAAAPSAPAAGEGEEVARAALEEVFRDPVPWLGRDVRATFQLQSAPPRWNPYLTRFGPRDYVAARVWSDGQFLWRAGDWEGPLGLVFARRDTGAAELLRSAGPHARFEARLRVRQVFLGRPWAEIVELQPLSRRVGEGTILHAGRALQLMGGGSWELALEDLRRAAIPSLPEHALDELERLARICQEQLTARGTRRIPVPQSARE